MPEAATVERPRLNDKNLIERKNLILEELKLDDKEVGTFEGYASTFGNVDLQGDVIEKGAFKKTVTDNEGVFPLLSQHDTTKEIGLVRAKEDSRGLFVKGEFYKDDDGNLLELAHEEYFKMKRRQEAGRPLQMSIGYRAINPKFKDGKRILDEIALAEVSLVTFPANPLAVTTGVKSSARTAADEVAERLKKTMEEKDFQGEFEHRAERNAAASVLSTAMWTLGDILDFAMWGTETDEEVDAFLKQLPIDLKDFSEAISDSMHAFFGREKGKKPKKPKKSDDSLADREEPDHSEAEPREHSEDGAGKGDAPASAAPVGADHVSELAVKVKAYRLRMLADEIGRAAKSS